MTLWHRFQGVFNELPLCARVSQKILCMHGGLSSGIKNWDSLLNLKVILAHSVFELNIIFKKPHNMNECDTGIAVDLMWADPKDEKESCTPGYAFNSVSFLYIKSAFLIF